MRSVFKTLSTAIYFLAIETVTLAPLAIYAGLLKAEGPLAVLYAWTGLSAGFLALAVFLGGITKDQTKYRTAFKITTAIASLTGITGILAVLIQVNAAYRSLAEAWLALAREGKAFGFFSFFAAEIYALFLLAQSILLAMKKIVAFAFCLISTTSLCAGIILGSTPILLVCLFAALAFFLVVGVQKPEEGNSGRKLAPYLARARTVVFPCVAAIIVALLIAVSPKEANTKKTFFAFPDMTGLLNTIAPSFPLIRDIPGYGFSAGAAEMPSSVFLSSRPLFVVHGMPHAVYYLATDQYRDWNGEVWLPDPDEGKDIPVTTSIDDVTGGDIKLTLLEDFAPIVPITLETESVIIANGTQGKAIATRNQGVRFEPSIRRGVTTSLVTDAVPVESLDEVTLAAMRGKESVKSERIAELAREIRSEASDDRDYIARLLDRFRTGGYTYSLKTGERLSGSRAIESFIFTKKTGFCLYFASAFVLLAREGGLPTRLTQGYRVSLNEYGEGVITGNNAHAWPEVLIDGTWRIFEPTIPYMQQDPFAYVRNEDHSTRKQLEAVFGSNGSISANTGIKWYGRILAFFSRWRKTAAITVASLAVVIAAGIIFGFRSTKEQRLKGKARALVKRFRRKGIPGPEQIGWIGWAKAAAEISEDASIAEIALDMIYLAFAENQKITRTIRLGEERQRCGK